MMMDHCGDGNKFHLMCNPRNSKMTLAFQSHISHGAEAEEDAAIAEKKLKTYLSEYFIEINI